MSTKEKIKQLLDKGLSPKEVAKKTGYKVNTIYTYRSMFKKEDESSVQDTPTKEVLQDEPAKESLLEAVLNSETEKENKTLKAKLGVAKKDIEKLEKINNNHLEMIKQRDEKKRN